MAFLVDFTTKSNAAKATTLAFAAGDFPTHQIDDYLVIGVTSEAEAALTISISGWVQIGATVGNPATATGLYSALFYKKCAGSTETATVTLSVSNAMHCHAFLIRDADTTTFIDGTPSGANVASASQFNSASIATTQNDSLILFYIGIDATTTTPVMCHSAPGPVHFIESSDNGGANITNGTKAMAAACAGWYVQRTPGATPTPSWNMSAAQMTNRFTFAIRNKAGGAIPPYIDDIQNIGTKLMDGHWWASATTRNNENFKATPLTVTSVITHLGTLTAAFDAGATIIDSHINPYSSSVSTSPAVSPTALTGFELGFPTTPINMTTGWVVGSLMESGPKLANFNEGSIARGGTFLTIGQGTNYRVFQIMAKDNLVNCEGRAVFSVQANQTSTQSGQSTTAPTITAIDKLCILNRGNTASLAQYCCDFHLIQKIIVAGGTNSAPVDAGGMYEVGRFLRLKLIQKQGAGGLLAMVPIQIGGGDAVNFQIDAGALQFPRIYNRGKREINYHGAPNAIGISYAGKAGDVIKHTNSVVTSPSSYYWEINAAATNAATWDFTGLVIVGASVTLRNVTNFDSMSFSACSSLNLVGCTLTNSSIKGVPVGNDTLSTNASTNIDFCAINVTGVAAGNRMCSVADPSIFTGCTFTGSNTTGHAIRITAPGTYTLSGNVFIGFGADTLPFAAIQNDSGGLVTLNITGGGNTPTVRNSAGSTTVINNSITVTIEANTSLVGAEIRVYDMDNSPAGSLGTELAGTESHSTTNYSYGGIAGNQVWFQIMKPGYAEFGQQFTIPASSTTLPVTLKLDVDS